MPDRKWYDCSKDPMPNPLNGDVWAEREDGCVCHLTRGMTWKERYRRYTYMRPEPKPTPPPYVEPLPAIAPCRTCGSPGRMASTETRVRCMSDWCWWGPRRATAREAIEAWNAPMAQPEGPKPVAGRFTYLSSDGAEHRYQLYDDNSWRPVKE